MTDRSGFAVASPSIGHDNPYVNLKAGLDGRIIEFWLQEGSIITCSDGVLGSKSELLDDAGNLMGG